MSSCSRTTRHSADDGRFIGVSLRLLSEVLEGFYKTLGLCEGFRSLFLWLRVRAHLQRHILVSSDLASFLPLNFCRVASVSKALYKDVRKVSTSLPDNPCKVP